MGWQGGFDCIDLSDNALKKLDNFPDMPDLRTLLVNNNLISRVAPDLGSRLKRLDTLVLTNNHISSLSELDNIASFKALRELTLLYNPVTKRENYRLFVIHKIPSLRVLDFTRVRDKVCVGVFVCLLYTLTLQRILSNDHIHRDEVFPPPPPPSKWTPHVVPRLP